MEKIEINLESLEEATNKFNHKILSNELDSFIENKALHTLPSESILLIINGLSNTKDQEKLTKLIHTYYQTKVKQLKKIDQYDDYIRLILLLLGIVLIIISEQFASFLSELFLIAGWVVVWEVVYDILFTGIKRKRNLKTAKKLAICQLNFIDKVEK